jgi:hypothetical protein
MRIIFTLLLVTFLCNQAGAASNYEYSEIVTVDGVNKSTLFQRALHWFNETFKSSKAVIQNQDKDAGTIFGNGTLLLFNNEWVDFSVSITVKDGKFLYEFKGLSHHGYVTSLSGISEQRTGGPLTEEKPGCGTFRMTKRYWNRIKENADQRMQGITADLKKSMATQTIAESF